MERVVFRHLSGSKKDQVEAFSISELQAIVLGRDEAANIQFDPEKDDLVSRKHATIQKDEHDHFILTDENSRNGTYLNKQRISGSFAINHGDIIQLGAGGPEFQFELDPPPKCAPPVTREASAFFNSKQTRYSDRAAFSEDQSDSRKSEGGVGDQSPGRVTMLQQNFEAHKTRSRQTQLSIGAGLLGLVILLSGLIYYFNIESAQDMQENITAVNQKIYDAELRTASVVTPKEIAEKYIDAVVQIRLNWNLIHSESNKQVYHRFDENGSKPLYLRMNNKIIPWLTTDPENDTNQAIMGAGYGTGFVVERNGFILTNRHVASSETSRFLAGYQNLPSRICDIADRGNANNADYVVNTQNCQDVGSGRLSGMLAGLDWVPIKEKVLVQHKIEHGKSVFKINFRDEGQYKSHRKLNVFFPRSNNPIPAELVRNSVTHDVALIRIAAMEGLPVVKLEEDGLEPAIGEEITILGYPGVSPDVIARTITFNPFDSTPNETAVPSPTLTTGNIGKRISSKEYNFDPSVTQIYSNFGDAYQLTTNETGAGNSGGPVFNTRGNVVAIFFASNTKGRTTLTFAIPISYGKEIMRAN